MDSIEACSYEGLSPQKQWGVWSTYQSFLPAEAQDSMFPKPYEYTVIKFKDQNKAKSFLK